MKNLSAVGLLGAFAVSVLAAGCASEAPPAAPPAPEPSRFPEPPPLPRDTALCVVRRFQSEDKAWHTTTYGYDSAARVLSSGPALRFDAEGRLTTIGEPDSDSFETQSYDARGDIYE